VRQATLAAGRAPSSDRYAYTVTAHRAYWRRWRLATWLLSFCTLASLAIGAGIGWEAKSTSVRIQDIVIAVVSAAATFALLRWCAIAMRHFSDRYLMTADKAADLVDEALAKGLLPKDYQRSPERDRQVAKTIRYDRKLGFSEAEIEKDLEAYLPR
jgi:hypothetical protein